MTFTTVRKGRGIIYLDNRLNTYVKTRCSRNDTNTVYLKCNSIQCPSKAKVDLTSNTLTVTVI